MTSRTGGAAPGLGRRVVPWLVAAAGAVAPGAAMPGATRADVHLRPVPASTEWPDAVEEGALRLACAPSVEDLSRYFAEEGLPFRRDLVRLGPSERCHVLYRPTVPGFRASPEDDPVRELLFDSDALLYLATSRENRGEPVGALREVLERIPRPLDVSVLLHRLHDEAAYAKATARAYGHTPHRVSLVDRGVARNFWWVQDYVEAGMSSRGETILVPRRIFEGRPENGEAFAPLLEALSRHDRVVRSRLTWEGGDLQFTRDPRDPGRLVLFHGRFAKAYWAETLTDAEFAYVLMVEFGADRAADLGGLAPHVDYFAAFLPRARTVLVSVPRAGDEGVARAAVDSLLARLPDPKPGVLLELRRALLPPGAGREAVLALVGRARREQDGWDFALHPTLAERMEALVARVCPAREGCFEPAVQARMAEAEPTLFEEWVHAVQAARDEPEVVAAHLDLVESQMETVPEELRRLTEEKARELAEWGFRVIRVPAFRVNLSRERAWPGISYVNGLVVDERVFLPRFGLGEVEDRIFEDVAARLPDGYSVVPVSAQRVFIRNGGLHCLVGIVRSPTD